MLSVRFVSAVLLLLTARPLHAAPTRCSDGRFLLPAGVTVLTTGVGSARQGIALDAGQLTLDAGCGPTAARVKRTKRATVVVARWRACGDRKRVVFKGTIAAPACDTLRGKVTAKKAKPVAFEAARSICGDGYADLAGAETCDLATDDITFDLLDAAHDAVAAGATDVPLSPDGTLRFVRTTSATGGTDSIVRGNTVLARWVYDGDTITVTADQDGDGNPELRIDAVRAPARAATVRFDLDDDGTVERTVTTEAIDATTMHVTITLLGESPTSFDTTNLQELRATSIRTAASVVTENCTPTEATDAETTLVDALTTGLPCLKQLGMDSVGKTISGKVLKDGVTFRCGATNDCAQADILDSLTHGLLPTTVGVNLGPKFFTGEGACGNGPMVLFHELLHVGLGDAHSPFLNRSDKGSLATDRVYSCTDMCFRPGEVNKRSCATCLGVDRCDAKCSNYPDLAGDTPCGDSAVEITSATCPSTACTCCDNCPPGVLFTETITGTARAPVDHYLRVNVLESLGGHLTCGAWSSAPCVLGSFGLTCCQRQAGQPDSTSFTATLPFPFMNQCVCPVPPPLDAGTLNAQIVTPENNAVVEDSAPITCP